MLITFIIISYVKFDIKKNKKQQIIVKKYLFIKFYNLNIIAVIFIIHYYLII